MHLSVYSSTIYNVQDRAQLVKNPPAMRETWVCFPRLGRSPGEGKGYPLQYSCLENPHGQRNLADCSPWGCKESDMTERLSTQDKETIQFPSTDERSKKWCMYRHIHTHNGILLSHKRMKYCHLQ